MERENIYIKLEQNVELTTPDVYIKDVASVYCRNHTILAKVKQVKIINLRSYGESRCVISSMKIIELIELLGLKCDLHMIGEMDVVVELIDEKKKAKAWRVTKILFVCLICFLGTSFTIMSYHNDIGINDLFKQYYTMVTGRESNGFTILELCYSIGLAVGIVVFFNHIGPRKITNDPTPIEVQMNKYESDVNTSLVDLANKGGTTIDVS